MGRNTGQMTGKSDNMNTASKFKLSVCVWELTTLCNLRCIHCGSKAGTKNENQLSLEKCLSVADELAEIGCENVCLIGGEVTLFPNWHLIADKLICNGVQTNIISNGYGSSEEIYTQIENSGICTVCISIDGMEENHNRIRGKADCFSQLKKFMGNLRQMGKYITAVTTLTKDNICDIEPLYMFLDMNEVKIWQLQICSPFGNARNCNKILPDKRDIQKIIQAYRLLPKDRMTVQLADNIGYYIDNPDGSVTQSFKGCSAGLRTIGIDSIGNVRGCESLLHDRFIEGNLMTQSLRDIWYDENNFAYNRRFSANQLTGTCMDCEHGMFCAGGCRSYNFFSHGKLYESVICENRKNPELRRTPHDKCRNS